MGRRPNPTRSQANVEADLEQDLRSVTHLPTWFTFPYGQNPQEDKWLLSLPDLTTHFPLFKTITSKIPFHRNKANPDFIFLFYFHMNGEKKKKIKAKQHVVKLGTAKRGFSIAIETRLTLQ